MFTKESLVQSLAIRIARAAMCVDAISARYSLGNHTSRVYLLIIITSTAIDRIERRSTSVDGTPRPRVANSRSPTENASSSNYNQDDSPSVVCSQTTLHWRGRRDDVITSHHGVRRIESRRRGVHASPVASASALASARQSGAMFGVDLRCVSRRRGTLGDARGGRGRGPYPSRKRGW